ncbi:hypothetical protein FHS94_003323 [Sphingomonas aerophila]|uniref:Uncharacterized protein n=1 Tax=Sphingomonas aerophila TaxID=1344948 RepID=A0A7W9BFY0_9SPHN|nr:hypothetical protein [Sphingomonas aerophila]
MVAISNTVWTAIAGFSLLSGWDDASSFQILIASGPFMMLSLFGVSARRPWIVGLCVTVAFWAYYTYVTSRPYDGGGANIGLGILMMVSPVPIAGACLLSLLTLTDGRSADEMASGR